MNNQKKIALRTATPTVHTTKARVPFGRDVEVRAEDAGGQLSVHYRVDDQDEPVPRVQEQVLVAILQGVPEGWLKLVGEAGEIIQTSLPSRSQGEEHRAEGVAVFQTVDHDRIRIRLQYPDATSDSVDLDSDQALLLVAALLGILRQML